MSETDESEYLEFATPTAASKGDYTEDEEELNWDNHEELPSFYDNNDTGVTVTHSTPGITVPSVPWVLDQDSDPFTADPYSVWPPRRLSSEFNSQLIVDLVPRPQEHLRHRSSNDELEEEVFLEAAEVEMGPKKEPTLPELIESFEDLLANWDGDLANVKEAGDLQDYVFSELQELYQRMKSVSNNARKKSGGIETLYQTYPQVKAGLLQITKDMNDLSKLYQQSNAPPATEQALVDPPNPDAEVEKKIEKEMVYFTLATERVDYISRDLKARLIRQNGEPVEVKESLTMDVNKYKKDLENIMDQSRDIQFKVNQEITQYSTDDLKNTARGKVEREVLSVKRVVDESVTLCIQYLVRVPAPNPSQPTQIIQQQGQATANAHSNLQRLPLRKFSGKTTDYLHFKEVHTRQAKYQDEGDKICALLECLTKKADKDRVSKEKTMAACWRKLDAEYGDITTLATECTSIIDSIKCPESDQDFVNFMDTVQDCLDSLSSVDEGKSYIPTLMLSVEKKLSDKMKDDLANKLVEEGPTLDQKPKFVMDFLKVRKGAAKLKLKNYASQKKPTPKNQKNETESKSNATGASDDYNSSSRDGSSQFRGRGRKSQSQRGGFESGRGRGQESRGRGAGGARGGGRGRRGGGDSDTKCLVCEEDHMTSRCPNWSSKKTSKFELHCMATTNLSKRLCLYCLTPGCHHSKCKSEEEVGCPCGSNVNYLICVKTPECVSRSNWNQVSTNTVSTTSSATIVNRAQVGSTLNPIVEVKMSMSNLRLRALFDNCSQTTFILESVANKLRLRGKRISFVLVCTDGSKSRKVGFLYKIKLNDIHGNCHSIQAIGMDKISSRYSGAKVFGVKKSLRKNSKCRTLTDDKLSRTGGDIELLVGTDVASLHPVKAIAIDDLVIMKTIFGNGWTMMGHNINHVEIVNKTEEFRVLVTAAEEVEEVGCNVVTTKDLQFLEAISTESLGIEVPPKCRTCKMRSDKCKECSMISNNKTYLEHLQDVQIDENIEPNPDGPGYIASYPYNSELNKLLPNEEVCLKRAEAVERKMMSVPSDLESINKEIQKSFDNGAFRFLSEEEIRDWDGPIHHLAMNVSYKDSDTTPVRLCYDSSQPDKNGRTLNDCMSKGSNPINHFGSVILSFRSSENVACGDITKMFQQVKVRPLDMHVRRFHMRPDLLGGKQPWKIAVPTCVNFGETAAPAVATRVKNRAADDHRDISPQVADMIKKDCIMDDINIRSKYSENLNDNLKKAELILGKGNFKIKHWLKSGDKGEKEMNKSELSKTLGLFWQTERDILSYRIKLNFNKKKRNRYLGPDTTLETLSKDFPTPMTKRLALKLNHSVFDPQNIVQPFILKSRLAFREILIFEKETENPGWDNPLPDKFRKDWLKITEEMFHLESLEFPRSLVPRNYDTNVKPILVLFSDGSDLAQSVVSYLVWTLGNGDSHISLVTSRAKVASMTKISTPKSELCAAQMSSRLRVWLNSEMDIGVSETLHCVDASIIIGMLKSISLKFDTFTAPRVTEIQMNTKAEEWFWVDTSDNPSDLATRGKCSIEDLGPGLMWREGPSWLKEPRDSWKIRSDFRKQEIPGLKKEFEILPSSISNLSQLVQYHEIVNKIETEVSVNAVKTVLDFSTIIDLNRFNCWFKLIRVFTIVIKVVYIFLKKPVPDQVELRKEARTFLLKSMMTETKEMLKTTKLSGFLVHEKDGLVYASTRNKQENHNPDDLIVLSPGHPITKMILRSFHNINHRGVLHGVARSRIFFWIPQASKIMKAIKTSCQQCKLNDAQAMTQLMAPIPEKRLKASPCWHFSMIDLLGPIEVVNFVNQRTKRKTWGVIITCLTSRATWVYLAESYSTDHLLSVLRKHEARNGSPAEYHADLGRQIVGADRVLKDHINDLDKDEMVNFAANRNIKFNFGTPFFPEGQGAVERLVKEVKKNLFVITKNLLTFGELDTLLAEASYLINSRPLQPYPNLGEDGFICANDLLFGRSDMEPPLCDIQDTSLTRRAAHKQRIIEEFWNKWSQSYLQTLYRFQKWRLRSRNVQPGDVVLVLDKELQKGKFLPAVVDTVKEDSDKVVRKVTIKHKIPQKCPAREYKKSKLYKYTERNVRGLALLVTKEEREKSENINLDDIRLSVTNRDRSDASDEDNDVQADVGNDEDEADVSQEPPADLTDNSNDPKPSDNPSDNNMNTLPSSSTGRKRWLPNKFRN